MTSHNDPIQHHHEEERHGFLSKINIYNYSVVFFSTIIVILWLFNDRDERRTATESTIREDLIELDGKKELFEKITSLIDGNTVKVKPSWLSFKQIQYHLRDRDFFKNEPDDPYADSRFDPFYYDANYYFYFNGKQVKTIATLPDTPGIWSPPNQILSNESWLDPISLRRGIELSDFNYNYYNKNSTDSILPVYLDYNRNQHFIRYDSTLKQFFEQKEYKALWATSLGCISYSIFKPETVYYSPSFLYSVRPSVSQIHTFKIDLSGKLDTIIRVGTSSRLIYIAGELKHLRKSVWFSIGPSYIGDIHSYPFEITSIDNSTYGLIRDSASNRLLMTNSGLRNRIPIGNSDTPDLMPARFLAPMRLLEVSPAFYIKSFKDLQDYIYSTRNYTLFRAAIVTKDSLTVQPMFKGNPVTVLCSFKDVLVVSDTKKVLPYTFAGDSTAMVYNDSILFRMIDNGMVLTPQANPDGVMLLPLSKTDFMFLRRDGPGKISAFFTPGRTWVMENTAFDYEVSYDSYYIVIIICGVIVLYFLGPQIYTRWQSKSAFDASKLPKSAILAEDYKLKLTYRTMDYLRNRSDVMLLLGITFGITGVLVSAVVFQTSNLNLSIDWKDPHTIINILKPFIILLFMETFTFYFLKQYRIIFNEYKLYFSVLLDLLSTNSIQEIEKLNIPPKTLALLQARMSKSPYVMYETDSKEKIDEFEHKSIIDLFEKLVKEGKSE